MLKSTLLQEREEVTCIQSVLLRNQHYMAVGTTVQPADDDLADLHASSSSLAKEGRVLLISPTVDPSTGQWSLDTDSECKTVGGVAAMTTIHGFLAVAAASTVTIYRYDGTELKQVSSFASIFIAADLYMLPPTKFKDEECLVVGDGMRSIIVLDIDEESGIIHDDDRNMATHQVRTMTGISDQGPAMVVADVRPTTAHPSAALHLM